MMQAAKNILHKIFRKCGYDINRYRPAILKPDGNASIRRMCILQDLGIDLILDIGASDGSYSREVRAGGYKGKIVSFEPREAAFEMLSNASRNDPLWRCEKMAVGERDGEKNLHVAQNGSSSSLLPILNRHVNACPESAYVGEELVRVVTVDSLHQMIAGSCNIYLKADVQGYEKKVLEGAREMLKRIHAIEIELSLAPLYEGGSLYVDMIEYLRRLGYGMVSWESVFVDKRTGYLLQSNGIFVRKPA